MTIKGLALGGVYALIAMGYTLVYGILKMINFAHSEVFMSGPFTAVFLAISFSKSGFMDRNPLIGMLLVTLLAVVVSATVAILLERIAYRPLRAAPRLVPLITAIGASFFLQYVFRGLYGSGFKAYPTLKALQGSVTFLRRSDLQYAVRGDRRRVSHDGRPVHQWSSAPRSARPCAPSPKTRKPPS